METSAVPTTTDELRGWTCPECGAECAAVTMETETVTTAVPGQEHLAVHGVPDALRITPVARHVMLTCASGHEIYAGAVPAGS
jgi:hypothetical protein